MILITGANGFIGRNLVKHMSQNGISVLASSRKLYDGYFDTLQVPFVKLDITKKKDFSKIKRDISSIIHLAAPIPDGPQMPSVEEYISVNGLGTLNSLEFCQSKKIARFVYISSQRVIGEPQYSPVDEIHPTYPCGKEASYGIGKLLGELFCERFRRDFGINCICLRPAMIYGYGQKTHRLIPRFIKSAKENKKIIIYGTGEFELDLLYIKDVITAILLAVESDCQGTYNIGTGCGISLKELAGTISDIFIDGEEEIVYDTSKSSGGKGFHFDISKAKKELGFSPKYSLRDGLNEMKYEMEKGKSKGRFI